MCDKHNKTIIKVSEWDEVYIVKYIAKSLNEFILISVVHTSHSETAFPATALDISLHNNMINFSEVNTASLNRKIKTYRLWHQQFVHLDFIKLHDLHKMTILEKSILIVENNKIMYEICALIKFINKQGHIISKRKANILVLVFIDIYSSLFLSFSEYQYFLKIVDNHFQKTWMILLKQYDKILQTLQKWQLKTELQTDAKILAVQSNNEIKLRFTLNDWCKSLNITLQYTVLYISIQNDIAERVIQIMKNSVHIMIKETQLSIKFWV